MSSKLKVIIIVIAGIGIIAAVVFLNNSKTSTTSQNPSNGNSSKSSIDLAKNSGVSLFSIEGQVSGISDNNITIKTTVIQAGKPVDQQKVLVLDSSLVQIKTGDKFTKAKFSDIKVDQNILAYTYSYPYDQSQIQAYSVVILK